MEEFLSDYLDSCITILGFFISYKAMKRNFKNEVQKTKVAVNVDEIRKLPYEICELMDYQCGIKQFDGRTDPLTFSKMISEKYQNVMAQILSYGSKEAVNIAICLQHLNLELRNSEESGGNEKTIHSLAAYALLITQIKYDLSGEVISPESWFMLRMSRYPEFKPLAQKYINQMVSELHLNPKFRVMEETEETTSASAESEVKP